MKSFYLGITLFLFAQTSFAQEKKTKNKSSRTSFGIKAGFSQFSLYGDDLRQIAVNDNTSSINSPLFAISITNTLNPFIALRHEVSYLNKGAKINLLQKDSGQQYDSKYLWRCRARSGLCAKNRLWLYCWGGVPIYIRTQYRNPNIERIKCLFEDAGNNSSVRAKKQRDLNSFWGTGFQWRRKDILNLTGYTPQL